MTVPLDLGSPGDQVFLLLFGTGTIVNSEFVTAQIGGFDAEVLYVGTQGDFAGLDQINLRLPRSLASRGEVDVKLSFLDRRAKVVKVNFK